MAQKFHVSKDGIARLCKAKGPCPLGGSELHFDTKQEAQAYADKANKKKHGLLGVDKESKKTEKEELKDALHKRWSKDEKMVKHILKETKHVKIGDSFVDIGRKKPTIHSQMYYDDETDGPSTSFNGFYLYNEQREMPEKLKLRGKHFSGDGKLRIVPKYDNEEFSNLTMLSYNNNPGEGKEVTEKELAKINEAIEEIQKDYKKRLKRYYKRYSDNIRTVGYWANR